MKILGISKQAIELAIQIIRNKELVVLPTDTLYGLCADALSDVAVDKVFKAKTRDAKKALPKFVASIEQAKEYAVFNDTALNLAEKYWPGALTLILPINKNCALSELIYSTTETVAVRVPSSKVVLDIISILGTPITGTSANISGSANNASIEDIKKELGEKVQLMIKDPLLEAKELTASTIIDCVGDKPVLIRAGTITNLLTEA